MTVVLVDELDVLNGVGGVVRVKDALSILDTVKVVDDVMLIRYNIEKNHLAIQRKRPSNVRLRNFLVLYLCFVLREVSLITGYFCYHVCCTLFCQPFPYAYYFL